MNMILLSIIVGIIAGIIDILPMIKMKLDKYSIMSAFIFYFIMPFIIFNSNLFESIWLIKGSLITLLLAIPIIIIVSKDDKKSIPPMVIMSIILGGIIGIVEHFVL